MIEQHHKNGGGGGGGHKRKPVKVGTCSRQSLLEELAVSLSTGDGSINLKSKMEIPKLKDFLLLDKNCSLFLASIEVFLVRLIDKILCSSVHLLLEK